MDKLYAPNPNVFMEPIAGLRFYADALRGDWGSIDGRSEKRALNEYIDWAETIDYVPTEDETLGKLESILGVYVIEESYSDSYDRRGIWAHFVGDEIDARDAETP